MPLTTRIEATCAGRLARLLAAIVISAAPVHAAAAGEATGPADCRIAFDMGSSGIRAGATDSERTARREFDALGVLWAGKGPAALAPASISALRELPNEAKFGSRCAAVGGGFSAWRLALQQDAKGLIETLARIHAESGVAVLVVPADREGAYGHYAARQLLGRRLTTTHVLDIGGGSLQIAGEKRSFAAPLGQKSWHRLLCEHLRDTTEVPCQLQPMNERDLTRARALIAVRIADAGLPRETTLTAISRPVSRGLLPAVRQLAATAGEPQSSLRRRELQAAIAQLAPLDLSATIARTGAAPSHAAYLFSDLLLVDGLMRLAADGELHIAEASFSNVPGLLADDQAYAWYGRYACYLQRLADGGIAAFVSDPATCPPDQLR